MNLEARGVSLGLLLLSVLTVWAGLGEELKAAPKEMAEKPSLQSMNIQYKGALVSDTCIPGEGKSEGITPEISSCVQIYPHPGGRKQTISFRAINRTQTTGESTMPDELERSGIHYSELIYDKEYPNPWEF